MNGPASSRDLILQLALELGFNKFQLIMDLPHSQRILINDFAPTNPFPSAVAISIPRNSASLSGYLPRSQG